MYNTLLQKKASIYDALRGEDEARIRKDITHKRIMPGRTATETPKSTPEEKSHLGRNLAIGGGY